MDLLIILGAIVSVCLILILVFFLTRDGMPSDIDDLIKKVQSEEIPEYITGDTGYADNGSVKLFYESIQPVEKSKGTVLLTNGLSYTLHDWPMYIVNGIVNAGFHVIRYDNRDVGMSARIKNWRKDNAYTLEDMAEDAIAVLDKNGIDKAHLVGVSMGGMISQRIAISFSTRVNSLTSIMSCGFYYDPKLNNVPLGFILNFLKAVLRHGRKLKTEAARMKFHLAIQYILKGKGDYEINDRAVLLKSRYELTRRNGYNPMTQKTHGTAIKKSRSRYDELIKLDVPTLVIHGADDPLVEISHARKYAEMLPRVKTLFVDGMGHDLAEVHSQKILKEMISHFESVAKIITNTNTALKSEPQC